MAGTPEHEGRGGIVEERGISFFLSDSLPLSLSSTLFQSHADHHLTVWPGVNLGLPLGLLQEQVFLVMSCHMRKPSLIQLQSLEPRNSMG